MPTRIFPMQTPTLPAVPAPPIPQVPGTTVPGPVAEMPIEMLQMQAAALMRQLAGLRVQRAFLEHQGRDDGITSSARAELDANRANLDVQIAQSQSDLDNVRAQIAARENVPLGRVGPGGQVIVPPNPMRQRVDPEMVIGLSFALLMVFAIPMSLAYARRIWRGKPQPAAARVDEIAPRLDRLEQAVDAIAIEVERISESQRFVTKILAERPPVVAASPRAEVIDSAMPEARPILALGAGAMEPIRVPDRQAVRQAITPH